MRKTLLSLLVVMLFAAGAPASPSGDLVARSIKTYEQIEALRTEMSDAVGSLTDQKRAYELAIRELDAKPKTRDQLDELAADLKRHAGSLKRLQADNGSESSVAYSRKRVHDLTVMLEAVGLQSVAERDAFRQKYQPRIDELAVKIQALEAPFQQQISEIQEPTKAQNGALVDVIRPFIKTPESSYPGSAVQHVNATLHMAFGSSNWNDRDDNQIAWAHIRIRSLDAVEDYHRENLLDGTYPIQSLSDGSIWVWAGHFLITFVVEDEALKGKETIQQAIHQFIDLKGLASIEAQARQVAAVPATEQP